MSTYYIQKYLQEMKDKYRGKNCYIIDSRIMNVTLPEKLDDELPEILKDFKNPYVTTVCTEKFRDVLCFSVEEYENFPDEDDEDWDEDWDECSCGHRIEHFYFNTEDFINDCKSTCDFCRNNQHKPPNYHGTGSLLDWVPILTGGEEEYTNYMLYNMNPKSRYYHSSAVLHADFEDNCTFELHFLPGTLEENLKELQRVTIAFEYESKQPWRCRYSSSPISYLIIGEDITEDIFSEIERELLPIVFNKFFQSYNNVEKHLCSYIGKFLG